MSDILVVEDDPAIRESIEYNLRIAGFDVVTASDGAAGLDMALDSPPRLVILDVMLPEVDGFEFCRRVREQNEETAILMVTALSRDVDKLKGFSLGADDYVTKPFSMAELLARVRANLRRSSRSAAATPDELLEFGDVRMDPETHSLTVGAERVHLRPKEFDLLHLLAGSPGTVFSRERLADSVWGYNFLASSRTIDVHIKRLREKVEGPSAYRFIRTMHGLGYKFELQEKPAESTS